MSDDSASSSNGANGRPSLIRIALWTGSLGIGALLLNRLLRRRDGIDVGAVSDSWVANRRGVSDDLTY